MEEKKEKGRKPAKRKEKRGYIIIPSLVPKTD